MQFKPIRHHSYIASLEAPVRYNLSDSCCEPLSLEELLAISGEKLPAKLPLHYASIAGHPDLRKAIAKLYSPDDPQTTIDPGQITVFCGAQEALFAAFQALLEPSDEVIIPTPCYPSLLEMPSLIGAIPVPLPLKFERGWRFDIEDFEQRLTRKTKLIVINSPHNPTGAVASSKFSEQLLNLAKSKQIYLISDDVSIFSDFNKRGIMHRYLSYDNAIAVGVLSKSFGLGGIRVGWAITLNAAIRQDMMTVKSYTSICPSVLDEQLARIAIDNAAAIMHRNNQIIRRNIEAFERFLAQTGSMFAWRKPRAGMMTLVKTALDAPLHDFAKSLARDTGVLILPGDLFEIEGDFFRLGLGRTEFPDVLQKFKAWLCVSKTTTE